MHSESFNTFLLKELVEQIKHINKKKDNYRFWLVKNTNLDKSLGIFIESYKLNRKLKIKNKIEDVLKYEKQQVRKQELHNSHFDKIKIGYYVEVENLTKNVVWCLEIDILNLLNWWFKDDV